jgi:hypothetical protein
VGCEVWRNKESGPASASFRDAPAEVKRPRLCGDVRITRRWRFVDSEQGFFADSAVREVHAVREKAVRDDIARRVRPACSHCSEEEFNELVRKMADQQVRSERKLSW